MSRVSDTRTRTRETAARLVAAGRRPHELTVDLIYAEIRQGSRTTINDELKLWKDEQAKVGALSTALPPAVANAMMTTWALAVEHGEKAFEQRREEVEGDLAAAQQQAQSLEISLRQNQEETTELRAQLASRTSEVEAMRVEAANLRAESEAARARAYALEQQLDASRAEADLRLSATKSEYDLRLSELQGAMAAKEEAFRTEIGKATERLEAIQKQVMAQVAEARETVKHTEALLAKAQQRNVELSAEGQLLKTELTSQAQAQERAQTELAAVSAKLQEMRTERESLLGQVAMLTGKVGAQESQIEGLERRAIGAETRLEAALKRSAVSRRKR